MGFAYSTERVRMGKGGLSFIAPVPGLYLSSAWVGPTSGGYYGSIATGYTVGQVILKRS